MHNLRHIPALLLACLCLLSAAPALAEPRSLFDDGMQELQTEDVDLDALRYGTTAPAPPIFPEDEIVDKAPERATLEASMQALKQDIIQINKELFILEEDLLFPASTRTHVYVAYDAADLFTLDGVTLKLDNQYVAHHLYTPREVDALVRGAVQRVYTGNLANGDHELVAVVTGIGPDGREYRRAVALDFSKSSGAKQIQLRILADKRRQQPVFEFKEWE